MFVFFFSSQVFRKRRNGLLVFQKTNVAMKWSFCHRPQLTCLARCFFLLPDWTLTVKNRFYSQDLHCKQFVSVFLNSGLIYDRVSSCTSGFFATFFNQSSVSPGVILRQGYREIKTCRVHLSITDNRLIFTVT